jgi:methionine-rich copper-binding protein CopC
LKGVVSARVRVLAMFAAAAVSAAVAVPAQAHSVYESSSPADGETVDAAPAQVYADYSEPPAPSDSALEIRDECDKVADDGKTQVLGKRMIVNMTATHAGLYTVTWHAVSLRDGHRSFGYWTFKVRGSAPSCGGARGGGGGGPSPSGTPSPSKSGGGAAASSSKSPAPGASATARANEPGAGVPSARPSQTRAGDGSGPGSAVAARARASDPQGAMWIVLLLVVAFGLAPLAPAARARRRKSLST